MANATPPAPPPPPPPPLPSSSDPSSSHPQSSAFSPRRRPPIRVTTEFDSDSSIFFHKVSSKFFDGLAKLKLTFLNNSKGEVADPQLSLITKNFAVKYDVEERNALLSGSVSVGPNFKLRAFHDLKKSRKNEILESHLEISMKNLSICCYMKEQGVLLKGLLDFPSKLRLRGAHDTQAQQGEVALLTNLADPAYSFELASALPSIGLPKATLIFPSGQASFEEKEDEEAKRILSVSSIVKGPIMSGVCTALYQDQMLNLKYRYKDKEMSFMPSIYLPSNALSFAFKRQFGPSDKLSYWYNLDSNYWSTVYKHTVDKDYKFKAGYDSEVRLGWASLWVGDESGKAKSAPRKMKVQFMLQVPQDDIRSSTLMLRVKKRWDI